MDNSFKIVEQLYLTNQYELALSKAKEIVEKNPLHFGSWTAIGSIYIKLKDYKQAIQILQKSLLINDEQCYAHKNIGHAYTQLYQHNLAIQHLLKSLVYDSSDTLTYQQLGYNYMNKQKYDLALQQFNRGLRYDQNNIRLYLGKAQCFYLMNKQHLAIRLYQIVVKLDPNNGEAYRLMGIAFAGILNNSQAIQCFGKAISINPSDHKAYLLQGINFYRQNLLSIANMNFDKVLQLDYKDQTAFEYYTMIKFSSHVNTERKEQKKHHILNKMEQYRQAGQIQIVDYFHTLFYTLSNFINGYLNLDISRNDIKYQQICAMVQNFINMYKIHKEYQKLILVFYDELEDILQMNEKQIKNKLDQWLEEDYLKKHKLKELNEVLAELCLEKSINKQDFTLNQNINMKSLSQHSRYRSITSQAAFADGLDIIHQILK